MWRHQTCLQIVHRQSMTKREHKHIVLYPGYVTRRNCCKSFHRRKQSLYTVNVFKEWPCWIAIQDLQTNVSDSACCPVFTKLNFFGTWPSLSWPSCSDFKVYYFPQHSSLFLGTKKKLCRIHRSLIACKFWYKADIC